MVPVSPTGVQDPKSSVLVLSEVSGAKTVPPTCSQLTTSDSMSRTRTSVRNPDLRSSRRMPLRLIEKRPALAEFGSRVGMTLVGNRAFLGRNGGKGSGKVGRVREIWGA
jgi:hypothetical protein